MAMDRYRYDKSNLIYDVGRIGRLRVLDYWFTFAGDSWEGRWAGVFRLSPLRRELVADAKVDLFLFHTPMRHVLGTDWMKFIQLGKDENITFPTINVTAARDMEGIMCVTTAGATTLPIAPSRAYSQIHGRYFTPPSLRRDLTTTPWMDTNEDPINASNTDYTGGQDNDFWPEGAAIPHMKRPWNTPVRTGQQSGTNRTTITTADRQVSIASNKMDITDLQRVRAEYKTEEDRAWFDQDYHDIIQGQFGGKVTEDAQQKSELLAHEEFWLSGYDIDGTDQQRLGSSVGKGAVIGGIGMPRKFIREHGIMHLLCVVRFQPMYFDEITLLEKTAQPTYLQAAGDPALIEAEPPAAYDIRDWFNGSSAGTGNTGFVMPYGQHYRSHPNRIHPIFKDLQGYPFLTHRTGTGRNMIVEAGDYDGMFQSAQLKHYQVRMRGAVTQHTRIPGPKSSIFAGV